MTTTSDDETNINRVRCETCGGRGTFHARGGAATGTCPLPPDGCGGFGKVDPATRAAVPRDQRPDSLAAMYARQDALAASGAAKIARAGAPAPTCCVKACGTAVDRDGDICQAHVDEIDRRLAALAAEAGISVDQVYAKLGAYCEEQARRRVRA